jgi:sigma-B regulation protein RsbU (phosphoserine phosphatase)
MENQAVAILRGELVEICIDSAFLFIGLTSCAIAALRRRSGVHIFLWIGVWSAAYGMMHLLGVRAVEVAFPAGLRAAAPYAITAIEYLLVVVASCAWLELSVGALRRVVLGLAITGGITAVLGIAWFAVTGDSKRFMPLNNLEAGAFLVLLLITLSNKILFQKYLRLPERRFLVFGTLVFTLEALCVNLTRPLFGFQTPVLFDHLGFLALLFAFGYSALKMVLTDEHRLLEIQAELEIARQIQGSILPTAVPELRDLRVSATYRPMTAVAGDFYEFLPVDSEHAGILVADVCGHGVPAALIASMLKVAVQSVAACASNPGQLLAGLNRVLAEPLRGQLVSAAYLWVDMRAGKALYSAAGHPPLLRWNGGLERIESNGLLFGIVPEAEYPVRELPLCAGDRLLLYTDGVTECEDQAGRAFGEGQLQRVLEQNGTKQAGDLSGRIMSEIQQWQRTAEAQDDMTLIVIDVADRQPQVAEKSFSAAAGLVKMAAEEPAV